MYSTINTSFQTRDKTILSTDVRHSYHYQEQDSINIFSGCWEASINLLSSRLDQLIDQVVGAGLMEKWLEVSRVQYSQSPSLPTLESFHLRSPYVKTNFLL